MELNLPPPLCSFRYFIGLVLLDSELLTIYFSINKAFNNHLLQAEVKGRHDLISPCSSRSIYTVVAGNIRYLILKLYSLCLLYTYYVHKHLLCVFACTGG